MGELCVGNDYNIQSKDDPAPNNCSSTWKPTMKNNLVTTSSTSKETSIKKYHNKSKANEKDPTANKCTTSIDSNHKILGDLKLYYDVVEELKNMTTNITVFELCKKIQLRE